MLLGKPRNRWGDAVWRSAADLLRVLDWNVAARKTGGWRNEIVEAIDRKGAEAPQKKKMKKEKKNKKKNSMFSTHCYTVHIKQLDTKGQ